MIPSILEPEGSSKEYRKNWARLIQKIYEVDPLTCPKCSGEMKVISVIDDEEVIEKILKHLGLWDLKVRPPPKEKASSVTIPIDDSDSQVPFSTPPFYPGPDYSMDLYRISKPRGVIPMVMASAINLLSPTTQKSENFISIYSHRIHDFYQ